ncbi:NAD(P)H-binding protein [Ekhidna sp.]|uniref:NAD(P)H-binding protein n=1 Tax=Ekhidna sp. TaxID=2608089 RepID=UPI003B5A22B0
MNNQILVIGGTGKTGRKVVTQLEKRGHQVRVGSRSATPAFDWEDPKTWSPALEGMDKVYITFQPDLAVPGALDAIEGLTKKAAQAGVKKLVLLSGKGEREAELSEQVVMHSGLDYTIVRASWFMQNFSESFFLDPILAGQVALPKPEAKVPYVDTDDIAEVVVEALLDDTHNGKVYELTGPRLITFAEVMKEISLATGRHIAFTPISLEEYIGFLKQADVPSDYIWLIDYLFSNVLDAEGNNVVSPDVEKVLGRKPKDFTEYVLETQKTGVWNPKVKETV